MKHLILIVLITSYINVFAQGQESSIASQMNKLGPLIGHWEGAGWIRQGESRSEFKQTEDVQAKLNGTTILIEGNGFAGDSLIFQAMAIASYDQNKNQYRFNSFLANGKYTEAVGQFSEDGVFSWQFDVPNGGIVKYEIAFTETDWAEKGYYSPKDVDQWYPFMEMKLTKINNNDGK